MGVAVEAYLRDDIPCGSSECLTCTPKTPRLAPNASHYVIPDAEALQELLEVFELPAFSSFVLLTSVLRKVIIPLCPGFRYFTMLTSVNNQCMTWWGFYGTATFIYSSLSKSSIPAKFTVPMLVDNLDLGRLAKLNRDVTDGGTP